MSFTTILSVSCGAVLGSLLRWWFGIKLNSFFPTLPLGTLTANLVGCFLMGIFIALIRNHTFLPEHVRLAITTGFLGALTTFSTFSGEAITLFSDQEYLGFTLIILGHVGGSLLSTFLGVYVFKFITS
ncbi:MAG TPA: fluoride efflux transporter CrcB [Chlamydiales bacterium]|nr:MAG: fluoride ion transporter CrcB [Verrucomicrobia bacterium RIFCSPHIGHO2_12_FULL_41_10]HLB52227.1 fluoride efflux transporter CrcB [Chlamydiales bacterium]